MKPGEHLCNCEGPFWESEKTIVIQDRNRARLYRPCSPTSATIQPSNRPKRWKSLQAETFNEHSLRKHHRSWKSHRFPRDLSKNVSHIAVTGRKMHVLVVLELPDVLIESPPLAFPEFPETAFPPPGRPEAFFEVVTPPGPPLAAMRVLSGLEYDARG